MKRITLIPSVRTSLFELWCYLLGGAIVLYIAFATAGGLAHWRVMGAALWLMLLGTIGAALLRRDIASPRWDRLEAKQWIIVSVVFVAMLVAGLSFFG